jgi:haloalkane dehalogenase
MEIKPMMSRHVVTVGSRRVHYRRCGSGPALLMIHQSPRSSAEYEDLMRQWGAHFTCIAPDSPGFGQSTPLPGEPTIDDFADSIVAFMDAIGLTRVAAYGFHSGGIILINAMKRYPERFVAMAVGGYAVWTADETRIFSEHYLPPFLPSAYGEHLVWLWNRILEQGWFFPWFDARPETRMRAPHADLPYIHDIVLDVLASGDAYRAGYGAVLRAKRDVPPVDAQVPPVLISAYDGDPLQAHIDRLGPMPASWTAQKVATPKDHHDLSLDFLRGNAIGATPPLVEVRDEGFVRITAGGFNGLIHWSGGREAERVTIPAPGRSAALIDGPALDPPGHGLSDGWPGQAPEDWASWRAVIDASCAALGHHSVVYETIPVGDPAQLFPDLTPDRFGTYLVQAWAQARSAHLFSPWYAVDGGHVVPFDPIDLAPEQLAAEHQALIQSANSARAYCTALHSLIPAS